MTDQLINRDETGYPTDESGDGWLECVPWTGQEASLPLGFTSTKRDFDIMKVVKKVQIADLESDEEMKWVKVSELKKGDDILDVEIAEKILKKYYQTFGKDFIRFKGANGGRNYNRLEWRTQFGTDVVKLMAVRRLIDQYGMK
jgi:hypothetical protein